MENGKVALVSDIIEICDDLRIVLSKAVDVVNRYWDCDVASEVTALATDTTLLPGTPIDKATMLGAITLLQQYMKFMNNEAVATNTYRITANKVAALKV